MPASPKLLVADSFRVRLNPRTGDAEARDLRGHFSRFEQAALEAWCGRPAYEGAEAELRAEARETLRRAGITPSPEFETTQMLLIPRWPTPEEQRVLAIIDGFLAEARSRIAAYGEGWPRLELWAESGAPGDVDAPAARPELRLSLRPLPELHERVELRTAGHLELAHPQRKGPNIARFSELNRELGAEAILTDERGRVREGATTSLVWWEPETGAAADAARVTGRGFVSASEQRVASVTESLLVEASGHGRSVRGDRSRLERAFATPAELVRCEVWAVNALHGIRVVTSIDGVPLPPSDEDRLAWFRQGLDDAWAPVFEDAR